MKNHEITFVENTSLFHIRSKKIGSHNTSGVRGVSFCKRRQKWVAYIGFKRKVYNLGYYEDLENAAKVRKAAEEIFHDNFLDWYKKTFPEKWAKI